MEQQFGEAKRHREELQEVCSDALKVRTIWFVYIYTQVYRCTGVQVYRCTGVLRLTLVSHLQLVKSQEVQIQALRQKVAERDGPAAFIGELRRRVDTESAKANAFKRKFELSETNSRNIRLKVHDLAHSLQNPANADA